MPPTPIMPLRVDADRRARWEAAASRSGQSLSAWARLTLDTAAGDAGKPARARPAARGATKAKRARTEICDHRRGPDEFCSRCDA